MSDNRTLADMIRDSWAEENARLDYEQYARRFFDREERARRRRDPESAAIYHDIGVRLAHSARAEEINAQPVGLGS